MMRSHQSTSRQKTGAQASRIAVIGGGMTGIAAALTLAQHGHAVTLYERETTLGGLCRPFTWRDVTWDRYYHVILSTDEVLLDFVRELGLSEQLFWRNTKTGFYGQGRLVSFSSTWDFMTFPFMTLWQKARLAAGILYISRLKDAAKLDRLYVRAWLTSVFGRRIYENVWDPLLRSKLGSAREQTSAAFIWATIARLYGARRSSAKIERMGHVHGGYATILDAAQRRLRELGVTIHCSAPVDEAVATDGAVTVSVRGSAERYDAALLTTPCPEAGRICRGDRTVEYWRKLHEVQYLRVACVSLVLSRPLSPYYVTNLLDTSLPFTGVIEATNIVTPADIGGAHLVYLPKYMPADDALAEWDDDQILSHFVEKLRGMFPTLEERHILHRQIFRDTWVQPLQEVNFLERVAGLRTPLPGVYLVNTSMIYNSTLNNNAAITLARQACDTLCEDLALKNTAPTGIARPV